MDLLAGYGSDSSGSESSPPRPEAHQPAEFAAKQPTVRAGTKPLAPKPKKKGKRLLSLQAVLPPEILDRLSRPEGEDSDSDADEGREKKRIKAGGDRSAVNSLLEELRSAPLQRGKSRVEKASNAITETASETSEGLGLAFMSSTTVRTKNNSGEVVDVHASKAKPVEPEVVGDKPKGPEPSRAMLKKPIKFTRMSAAAPVSRAIQQPTTEEMQGRNTHHIQSEAVTQQNSAYINYTQTQMYSEPNNVHSSRKQRREQERSLRSGGAFHNTSTVEIHQPSPTEYAPTAHMAAIASRAAHLRNLGSIDPSDTSNYGEYGQQKAKALGVAMYDPKTGTDVKGGVTGKHKSKHQINQLMVSAMGLEANRAGEAELARLGLGRGAGSSSGGRAEAKNKYGW